MTRVLDRFAKLGKRLRTFRRIEIVVAEHRDPVTVEAPVTIVEVDAARVDDVRSMDPPARIEEFHRFLARGDRGFYAYREGRVVNRAWVVPGPRSVDLWHGYGRLGIPSGHAYLHYCETAADARGLGIYPAVLAHVARVLETEGTGTVSISTTADNQSSLRGIARAGFHVRRRIEIRIAAGFGIQRTLSETGASA
jgi:ribosomal protein S18 acetylase RimI-like enzyme